MQYKSMLLMLTALVCAQAAQTPGLRWGGSAVDEATAVARDAAGNLYVAGTTYSTNLAAAGGGLSARPARPETWGDVFVQKVASTGEVVWRAVFGGSGLDRGKAVAVDAEGNVFVAGMTQSFDFPASANAYKPKSATASALQYDAFVVKLVPAGNQFVYSTYFGGTESDEATAIGIDALGQAVVAGDTYSDNLPTTGTSFKAKVCAGYGYDGWVAKLSLEGNGLLWGTYVCGSGHDHVKAMTVDRQGAVYVAGETASSDFPVSKGAFREAKASPLYDGFVLKLAASGNSMEWSTLYGGVESEWVHALALKTDGRVVIGGETRSSDLPGAGAAPTGMMDGFVAQFSADGKSLDWARLAGGAGEDRVTALSAAGDGRVWAGGVTKSNAWAGDTAGGEDGFLARFASDGAGEPWVTRLGGRLRDRVTAVKATTSGVAVAGWTEASEWLADGSTAGDGQSDAFLAFTTAEAPLDALPTESRARRPESGFELWSGAGRIPLDPHETVSSGKRWMVELSSEPAATHQARWRGLRGLAREQALTIARDTVRAAQSRLRPSLEAAGARLYGSTDLIANLLFVEAPADAIDAIRNTNGVKRVVAVSRVEPDLDTSNAIHKIGDAWARAGGWNMTGAGVKIGIIDTGVESGHPMLADPGVAPLEGFPRANRAADLALTNPKVIVARGYVPVGAKPHARDDVGHGTGVAGIAAGSPVETQLGVVAGVAPMAYVGNYKMMTNDAEPINSDDTLVTALEDAAADGMDVVNLSLHTYRLMLRPEDDIYTDIFERLSAIGTMVVKSTGNEGPEFSTLTAPHVGEWGIMVASHLNGRITVSPLTLSDGATIATRPGANVEMSGGTIDAQLVEVQTVAPGTWGCSALPEEPLKGRIALIDRGGCNFSVKGENARKAGAVAFIVMALAESPEPIVMGMGAETLPGFMVSHADGQLLRAKLAEATDAFTASIGLSWQPQPSSPDAVSSFSSSGPGASSTGGIKPDLIATGSDVWTARASGGYSTGSGTSFSAPHVTGAIAALKAARPGLDTRLYRSLIINTAEPMRDAGGEIIPIMRQGAGRLNVDAALASSVVSHPTSLHMGSSRGDLDTQAAFRLQNIGPDARSCTAAVEARNAASTPSLEPAAFDIGPASETWLVAKWTAKGLATGQYDGHIRVRCEGEPYPLSIPYWHGVRGARLANIKIVEAFTSGKAGATLNYAFTYRLIDESGLPVDGLSPAVTVKEGAGAVVQAFPWGTVYPGIYGAHVRPAAGRNVFLISIGGLTREVTITGE